MFPTTMPSPRLPDRMAAPPLRWGVLGTGWIAERFTAALHRHDGVLGVPTQVFAIGQDVPGGEVNGQVSILLRHTGGAQSTINTTIMADTPTQAVLALDRTVDRSRGALRHRRRSSPPSRGRRIRNHRSAHSPTRWPPSASSTR